MTCPNHCTNGWVVNPYTHKRVRYEHCLNKVLEEAQSGELSERLNLPVSYVNGEFKPEAVFTDEGMEKDSVEEVLGVMRKLVGDVSIGELPDHSMLFNLGKRVYENNFLNPLVYKACLAGVDCLPVLTSLDITIARHRYEEGIPARDGELTFDRMLSAGLGVVTIDAGETRNGVLGVKGFMQLRARKGNPTIILTHIWNESTLTLIGDREKQLSLATAYSIRYAREKYAKPAKSAPNRGMTREEFDSMRQQKNFQ